MSSSSDDMVFEILARLPAKSLVKFKSVSKKWCSLVDSPAFVKHHLGLSMKKMDIGSCRVIVKPQGNDDSLRSVIEFDSGAVEMLGYEFPRGFDDFTALSSCNGLMCLFRKKVLGPQEFVIFNPCTGKFRKVPTLPFTLFDTYECCGGFGYDSLRDDYNVCSVVRYFDEIPELLETKVHVYSMKSNSWEFSSTLPDALGSLDSHPAHECAGSLHFFLDVGEYPLCAFDLRKRSWSFLDVPAKEDDIVGVGNLSGQISLVCRSSMHCDLWVMKEYGAKDSWAKVVSIPFDTNSFKYVGVQPIAYSENGRRVFFSIAGGSSCLDSERRFAWADIDNGTVEYVEGLNSYTFKGIHMESLVKIGPVV